MASGITLQMIRFSHGEGRIIARRVTRRDAEPRDRSLNGKARIKARKARNKRGW